MDLKQKETSFQRAFRQHETALIRYTLKMTRNLERAHDLVQETFLKWWHEPRFFEIESQIPPWLYVVCRNLAIDEMRRLRKQTTVSDFDFLIAPEAANPAWFVQMVGLLSGREQEILVLKFQNDLSYKEIAEITGLTVTNVGFILHTSLKKLKDLLVKEGVLS